MFYCIFILNVNSYMWAKVNHLIFMLHLSQEQLEQVILILLLTSCEVHIWNYFECSLTFRPNEMRFVASLWLKNESNSVPKPPTPSFHYCYDAVLLNMQVIVQPLHNLFS